MIVASDEFKNILKRLEELEEKVNKLENKPDNFLEDLHTIFNKISDTKAKEFEL